MIKRLALIYEEERYEYLKELKDHSELTWENFFEALAIYSREAILDNKLNYDKRRLNNGNVQEKENKDSKS